MSLADDLQRRSPVEIDGVPHDIWLLDVRVLPGTDGSLVEVKVAGRNPSGRHYIGRFQVETAQLHDSGVRRALETMERTVRGGLPPTARDTRF